MTTLSFEFFPPKDATAVINLRTVAMALSGLHPAFMTVTYGAGGSTRTGTLDAITDLKKLTNIPIGAHLTFYGLTKSDLQAYADELWSMGVRDLVALRGDPPRDGMKQDLSGPDYFQKTGEFVAGLKKWHPFKISVGAYPEIHPASPSRAADLMALKDKMDQGADQAITQFFFNNDIYFKFIEDARAAGIQGPLLPGLMPIHDIGKVTNFASKCGATVPDHIIEQFKKTNDPKQLAIDLLATQMRGLIDAGVPHIHLYTLNRSDLILAAAATNELRSHFKS
jgi:methylenetetrahydrofolate reductase (NADPH)